MTPTRSRAVGLALTVLAGISGVAACGADSTGSRTLRVEAGGSISDVVSTARPGDVVVVADGVYHETVRVAVPGITLRGESRNGVVLDGEDRLANGVTIVADGVAVENLTVRSYTQNGLLFNGIEAATGGRGIEPGVVYGTGDDVLSGYRASYVTAFNNGLYGIYAFASRDGLIEHSYVSGHPDSGVYVGQCNPCNTVVSDVTAELNAIGYYGTNASGEVYVIDSVFRHNRLGIAPNSQRAERLAPQSATVVGGNLVIDNDSLDAPPIPKGFIGVGIAVGGGTQNLIVRNRVVDNDAAGIALLMLGEFAPLGNTVEGNVVEGNGVDLVYAPGAGVAAEGNCFADNRFGTSTPDDIETVMRCGSDGTLTTTAWQQTASPPGPDYRDIPAPPAQPDMPVDEMTATGGAGVVPDVDVAALTVPTG